MLKALGYLFILLVVLTIGTAGGGLYIFYRFGAALPDYQQLAGYEPPTVTRVHAGDGRLLAEFAREKRMFVPISAIPKRVINAFLSAEDKTFFTHYGIDPLGVARAALFNVRIRVLGEKRRPIGGSTITQQVAKNFLLTNEVSYERKIKEAILALRIERAFTKQRILELYLNEIYLGFASYGVAAAALDYFNKSLDDLTLAESAYLAALPKGPNDYHPLRNREAALAQRYRVRARRLLRRGGAPRDSRAVRREGALRGRALRPHHPGPAPPGDRAPGLAPGPDHL
jgi:penicillin-binding protein 1A